MTLRIASRIEAKPGEDACGDGLSVRTFADVQLLVVFDGVGHGTEAHAATRAGLAVVEALKQPQDPVALLETMHEAMRGTRGAAVMLCEVRGDGSVRGAGVGNVSLRTTGAQLSAVSSPGILGSTVRRFRGFQGSLQPRARLFMFSDGIERFDASVVRKFDTVRACEALFEEHRCPRDDATLLVADFEDA